MPTLSHRRISAKRGGKGVVVVCPSSMASLHVACRVTSVARGPEAPLIPSLWALSKRWRGTVFSSLACVPAEVWKCGTDAETVENVDGNAIPSDHIGETSEMANEAVCRRSEQASYLTVAILNESGGHEILMPPPRSKGHLARRRTDWQV